MELILIERINRLGNIGDVVRVKDGYGRHFLLPRRKALRATPENRKRIEKERDALEAKNRTAEAEAEAQAEAIEGRVYVSIRQASESGQLYGSVRGQDIADILSAAGTATTHAQIMLAAPIKQVGLHAVRVRLHADVTTHITLNVARSPDEAEHQEQEAHGAKPQDTEDTEETQDTDADSEDSEDNEDAAQDTTAPASEDVSDSADETTDETPDETTESREDSE